MYVRERVGGVYSARALSSRLIDGYTAMDVTWKLVTVVLNIF